MGHPVYQISETSDIIRPKGVSKPTNTSPVPSLVVV